MKHAGYYSTYVILFLMAVAALPVTVSGFNHISLYIYGVLVLGMWVMRWLAHIEGHQEGFKKGRDSLS